MPTNNRTTYRLIGGLLAASIAATAHAAAPEPNTPLPPPGASGQLLDQGNQIDYQIRNLQKELQKSDLENQLVKAQARPTDAASSLPRVKAIEGFGSHRLATLVYPDNSETLVHAGSALFDQWKVTRIDFGRVVVSRKGHSATLTNMNGVAADTL
ncbi:type IV pilus biogenesis protein PilP [Paludibacterium paludis]|uniref:Type IV pilus biogenesis protein PilP n=1 Tax=Paludibacterium paludis TaxID=1225769 RepID=A0A918P4B0_9NEIS|nr:type IV pilus biogenesis protein PilP [Paludibacterium paludis]GGY20822.1 hypothetical protein GCM10011289_25570 [Paludibacterium paludis]